MPGRLAFKVLHCLECRCLRNVENQDAVVAQWHVARGPCSGVASKMWLTHLGHQKWTADALRLELLAGYQQIV